MTDKFSFTMNSRRIQTAMARLAGAYRRQSQNCVPVVEPNVRTPLYSTIELLEDLDKMLHHSITWANSLAETDNDWPPILDTYPTVVMVPEAFGCEIKWTENCDPWTRPAVADISHVWNLIPQKPSQAPLLKRTAEWIQYAQRRLGAEVPFWTMDLQSPFSAAAHILEPSALMIACIENSKAVHHLLKMITDYSIEMMKEHLSQMEHPGFPGRNFPSISENVGICISDDTPLIMLSPEMYREFALPYNSQIGKAFGGLHVHSCGNYTHNLENMMKIENIRSFQVHAGQAEFPLPENAESDHPFNVARSRLTYFVDVNDVSRGDLYHNRHKQHYSDYVLPRLKAADLNGLILQSCGSPDLSSAPDAITWTRKAIGTPTTAAD